MLRLVLILTVLVTFTNCFSFEKFSTAELLSISCDYASLVTRSRRSIVEPDLENPAALFDFFYPLADVKVEDHVGSRTVHQSSWMDEVGLLWQHFYCRRRPKRRSRRNVNINVGKLRKRRQEERTSEAEEDGGVIGDMVSWAGYLGSYLPSAGQPTEEIVEDDDGKDHEVEISYGEDHDDEEKIVKVEVEEEEEEEEEEEDEDKESEDDEEEEEESTTAAPAAETTTTPKPEDPYFSSYGGDVEYFIPLISFTIPFDGEITVLGFHGFKGMFPY